MPHVIQSVRLASYDTISYHTEMSDTIEELKAGTLHLTDQEFLDAFESGELPGTSFHHADHIRLAWIYLLRLGAGASDASAVSIRRYATHLGAAAKYHETITRAWMILVAAADRTSVAQEGSAEAFRAFAAANPTLFEPNALAKYYSKNRLSSEEARSTWLPPDLAPLP